MWLSTSILFLDRVGVGDFFGEPFGGLLFTLIL